MLSTLKPKPSIGFIQLPSSQNIFMKPLQSCFLIFSPKCFKEISQGDLNTKILYAFLVSHRSYTQVKHRLLDDGFLRSDMPVQKNVHQNCRNNFYVGGGNQLAMVVQKSLVDLRNQLASPVTIIQVSSKVDCNGSPEVAGPLSQLVDKSCDKNSGKF